MPIEPRLTVQSTLGPECDIAVTPWRETLTLMMSRSVSVDLIC